jgi:hypothetical protein
MRGLGVGATTPWHPTIVSCFRARRPQSKRDTGLLLIVPDESEDEMCGPTEWY